MTEDRREEQLRIQAVGAALSRRDWHAVEQAYNAIRDEFDRRPVAKPPGTAVEVPTIRVEIAHDGFSGDIIGRYITREGKRGVVVQQDGTRVVHVYGEKWLTVETQIALVLSESALDPADLQLLMQLQRDNKHDSARPVISRQPAVDQAFRLSENGLIALEQVAHGVRLHITRKGVKAIPALLYTAGES